jgi:predicted phage tail protein
MLALIVAVLLATFGIWAILKPKAIINKFVHPDDRAVLAGSNWLWFIRALGIAFILLGIGQLVDALLR